MIVFLFTLSVFKNLKSPTHRVIPQRIVLFNSIQFLFTLQSSRTLNPKSLSILFPSKPFASSFMLLALVYRKGVDLPVEVIPEVCRLHPNVSWYSPLWIFWLFFFKWIFWLHFLVWWNYILFLTLVLCISNHCFGEKLKGCFSMLQLAIKYTQHLLKSLYLFLSSKFITWLILCYLLNDICFCSLRYL